MIVSITMGMYVYRIRRRDTRSALVTEVQTCALPIYGLQSHQRAGSPPTPTSSHARVVMAPNVIRHLDALRDIHAGAEGPLARGTQDADVDVVVAAHPVPDVAELVDHRLVEAVHHVGTVQGDRGDVVDHLEQDRKSTRLNSSH